MAILWDNDQEKACGKPGLWEPCYMLYNILGDDKVYMSVNIHL